jgi:signal peptidase I
MNQEPKSGEGEMPPPQDAALEAQPAQTPGPEQPLPGVETQPEPVPAMRDTGQAPAYGEQGQKMFGIQAFFTVVIYSIFVITFIVQAFQIPSGSMENTLMVGDFLLVDKLHFAGAQAPGRLLPYANVQRGDIVVFYYPVDSSQFLVKRVIGVPGDHIRMRNRIVYVNGSPLRESYAIYKQWAFDGYRDNFPSRQSYSREIDRRWRNQLQQYINAGEVVVPADQYFVLGDNRDQSLDSRYWGFVPRANIVGRPLVIYLSVKEAGQGGSSDKLLHSGQMAHWLHLARWDRMFRLVR